MNKHTPTPIDDIKRRIYCAQAIDILEQLVHQQQAIDQLGNPKNLQHAAETIGVRIATTRNSVVRELSDKLGDNRRSAGSFARQLQHEAIAETLEKLEADRQAALKLIATAPIAEPYKYKAERALQ